MIIGHQKIIDYFERCIRQNNLAHAYIFTGPEGLGKKKLAFDLVKHLQCLASSDWQEDCDCQVCQQIKKNQHPDFSLIDFADRQITKDGIGNVRNLINRLSRTTCQSPYKIGIIDNAHLMNKEPANALLKTLEEPPPRSLLILITHQPSFLLPTIFSRCQEMNFSPLKVSEVEKALRIRYHNKTLTIIKRACRFCFGRPGLAINYLQRVPARNSAFEDLKTLIKTDLTERFFYAKTIAADKILLRYYLEQWLILLRDGLLTKNACEVLAVNDVNPNDFRQFSNQRLIDLIRQTESIQEALKDSGLNHRLILENFMLNL